MSDLITGSGYANGHERADQIKDAIGKIGPCGDTQYRGLGHAAGRPGNQDGGHRNSIFGGTAQLSALKTSFLINLLKHLTVQDDGDELIRGAQIQRKTGDHRGGHHAGAASHEAQEELCDIL